MLADSYPSPSEALSIQMKIDRLLYFLAATALGAAHADGPELKAVQHPMSELHAIAKFSIPGSPDWVAIGDSVWISNNPKNNISQLDAKTNQVGAVITVAKTPCSGLAIAFGSVWVPICSDGSVRARGCEVAEDCRFHSFGCREHGGRNHGGRRQHLDAFRCRGRALAHRSGDQ